MKRNPQFEINELEVCTSFILYHKIRNAKLTCKDQYAPVDIEFTTSKGIDYSIEVKCRNKEYRQQMIEKKKLVHFYNMIPNEKVNIYGNGVPNETQCRFITYIEDTDKLIIYDINSRVKNGLELEETFNSNWYTNNGYDKIDCYASTESYKKVPKYVAYLYLNYFQTKDLVIDNWTKLMKTNNIPFNYESIN